MRQNFIRAITDKNLIGGYIINFRHYRTEFIRFWGRVAL